MSEAGHAADAVRGVTLAAGSARIWGMTGAERLERIFRRVGVEPTAVDAALSGAGGDVLIARADWVFDESLIKALAGRANSVLLTETGQAVAAHVSAADSRAAYAALEAGQDPSASIPGLARLDPAALSYNEALRKKEPPVLEPLTRENVRAVEARTFQGSYKGVTDLVTKYVWPTPARIVTRWCALAGITPNQVTLTGFLLVLAAFWLFWTGHFGWGLLCGWIMTFLDTVDGKLARVTLTSSKWGNVLDHGIDLVHPPFWWWAWYVGVLHHTPYGLPYPELLLGVILVGYVVQRVFEGIFMRMWGFHVHAWRPFDSWFRLITARRNPNLVMMTPLALLGYPDAAFVAIALWTALSLVVHLAQLIQAFATPRERVVSWLSR